MEMTAEAVKAIFRQAEAYPEEKSNLLRDRSQAFYETLIYEIECFE